MKNLLSLFIALILSVGTVASAKGVQYEGVVGLNISDFTRLGLARVWDFT